MSSQASDQIKLLRELQEIDRQIRDIERAKSDLPLRRAELRASRERDRADIDNAKTQQLRNDEERRRLEKEIAFDKEALERFEERAQDVSSPDAFNAANRELDTRRKAIKEKEDQIVRLMEEREVLEKKAAQLEVEFAEVDRKYAEQEKELEAQNAEVDERTSGLRQQRAELAKGVERGLLSRYDMVFKRREGIAVVAVASEVCRGCDMGVPPQIANFVRSGEQGVQSCPHCNRILFWEARTAPVEEKKKTRRGRKKKEPEAQEPDGNDAEGEEPESDATRAD